MKIRNISTYFLKLIAIVCLLSKIVLTSYGQTNYESRRGELKNQNEGLSNSINEARLKIEEKKLKKIKLDEDISNIQDQMNYSTNQILILDNEINEKLDYIDKLQKDVEKNKEILKKGANAIFKMGGDVNVINLLLNCSDINGLFSTYQMIKSLSNHQNKVIHELNESSKKIMSEKNSVEEKREQILDKKRELGLKKDELYNLIEENDKLINELSSSQENEMKRLDVNSEEIKKLDAEIAEYYARQERERAERERAERERAERERAKGEKNNNGKNTISQDCYSKSGYAWPVPGFPTLTSTYNEWRGYGIHGAIDIGGYRIFGQPIVAVESGVVITSVDGCRHYSAFCRCGGGYGNYVVIDHGSGRSTLYAHMCRVDVYVGQIVKKGQVLGGIGSTGHSTGPHLHFETRKYVNGSIRRYDPMLEY